MTKPQTIASNKYHKDKYDRLYPFVLKGRKSEIQACADHWGESLNDFIVKAIDERMERLQGYGKPQYKTPEQREAIKGLRLKGSDDDKNANN